jgi:hypothetical protein
MESTDENTPTLAYATPALPNGSALAAGVWITLAGLALIFLGGCFCIGVMFSLNAGNINVASSPGTGKAADTLFIVLLYTLAIACFTAAACVMVLGIRKLLSIGRP